MGGAGSSGGGGAGVGGVVVEGRGEGRGRKEEKGGKEREGEGGREGSRSVRAYFLFIFHDVIMTGRKHREPFPSVQCETKFSAHRNQASHIFSPRNHYNVFGFDPQQLKLQVCEEYIQSSVGLWVVYCGHMNWST